MGMLGTLPFPCTWELPCNPCTSAPRPAAWQRLHAGQRLQARGGGCDASGAWVCDHYVDGRAACLSPAADLLIVCAAPVSCRCSCICQRLTLPMCAAPLPILRSSPTRTSLLQHARRCSPHCSCLCLRKLPAQRRSWNFSPVSPMCGFSFNSRESIPFDRWLSLTRPVLLNLPVKRH